jgi:hypothetical protein
MGKMKTFFHAVQRWLEEPSQVKRPEQAVAVRRHYIPPSPTSTRSGSRIVVNRIPHPYWEERGWRREGRAYTGTYQTLFGSWHGYVTVSPSGRVEVFIHNPPSVLERHPHWPCFNQRSDGWFFVHPVTRVADVSAGILAVEKTIAESYEI